MLRKHQPGRSLENKILLFAFRIKGVEEQKDTLFAHIHSEIPYTARILKMLVTILIFLKVFV